MQDFNIFFSFFFFFTFLLLFVLKKALIFKLYVSASTLDFFNSSSANSTLFQWFLQLIQHCFSNSVQLLTAFTRIFCRKCFLFLVIILTSFTLFQQFSAPSYFVLFQQFIYQNVQLSQDNIAIIFLFHTIYTF